jgi:hypothetical protein
MDYVENQERLSDSNGEIKGITTLPSFKRRGNLFIPVFPIQLLG